MSSGRTLSGLAIIACMLAARALMLQASGSLAEQAASSQLNLSGAKDSNRVETRHLTVTTSATAVAAQGRVTLFVDVNPKPKMHVYSPEQKDAIPVGLTVETNDSVRPGATKFPKPEKYFFAPLKETQFVYSRPFRLSHEATLTKTAQGAGAALTIKGTLRYQACDDAVCYMPQNVPVSWTVER
jgi:DsbC/DsbD-like thiol-disulfide interchange protein